MQANQRVLAAILRTDFLAFAQKTFAHLNPGTKLRPNWHHQALVYQLERVFRSEIPRLLINVPPRSLKSTFGSVAFPAFVLGKRPTSKIICASYSQELANKHAGDFRKIVQSQWYKDVFQPGVPAKEAEAEFQTDRGGYRLTTSVGGTLTGRGGDIIVIDDPLNANEAHSKASREQVNNWFGSTLLSRLDDKNTGAIIIIMQRLHQDDLTGFLLEQGGWEHLKLPAIATSDISVRLSASQMHECKNGEPLDAVREPLSTLDSVRRTIGTDNFNAQFLQEPVPESGNLLKREWLHSYDIAPVRQPSDQIVQSWDTAMKATDTSDYTVCLTFLIRNKNQYHLIDAYRERPEFPELAKRVSSHAQKYRADAILIEDKGSGTSLIQTAHRSGLQGVIGRKPSSDKISRMQGQTPKLEAGSLYLPRSAAWLGDFIVEYLAFPKARHDDQIDALSQFLEWQSGREGALFEWDWGDNDIVGAPSVDSLLRQLRRA